MTTFTSKGIEYGWVAGENGWGDPMNLNLQRLSAIGFGPFSIGPDGVSGLDIDVTGGLWWNASTETWDTVADATLTLTNGATNYVQVTAAGVISANTTGWTYGSRPIATVVTAGGAVTAINDMRTYGGDEPIAPGRLMGRARSGTTSLKTGLDAVGSNTAAVDFIVDAPRSTGNATPALWKVRVAQQGASSSTLQTLVDAWQVGEHANATTREVYAWNPAGPVMGLLPTNANAAAFFEANDGGRFANRVKIGRIGTATVISGIRGETSFSAPTPPLSGVDLFLVQARPVVNAATGASAVTAQISFVSRENLGTANFGTLIRFGAGRIGGASQVEMWDMRYDTAISELVASQATARFIPATSGSFAWRNAANSSNTMTLNEAGTTWTLPLATAAVIGTDPGGGQLVRIGGSLRAGGAVQFDSTLTVTSTLTHNGTSASLIQGATGFLAIGAAASTSTSMAIRGAAATNRDFQFSTGTSLRWTVRASSSAESGANAGTNWQLIARDDDGTTPIDTVIDITRIAGGTIAFSSTRPITSGRISIGGTYTAASAFVVSPTITATGAVARGGYYTPVLTAAANGDTLYGLQVQPSVNVGAFTGTTQYGIFVSNVSGAATNYAIRTGTGRVQFGDVVSVGGATVSTTSALTTPAGTTGVSSLRIPHGAAPSSPVDGDMWTTTAGLFVRINGATVGPLS